MEKPAAFAGWLCASSCKEGTALEPSTVDVDGEQLPAVHL